MNAQGTKEDILFILVCQQIYIKVFSKFVTRVVSLVVSGYHQSSAYDQVSLKLGSSIAAPHIFSFRFFFYADSCYRFAVINMNKMNVFVQSEQTRPSSI